jgi:hypothetical protein
LLLLAAACSSGGDDDDSSGPAGSSTAAPIATRAAGGNTGGSTPTGGGASTTPAAGGAAGELAGVFNAYSQVRSYRARMELEVPGAPKQEGTMEVVLPDRYKITLSSGVPSAGNIEMIMIGSDLYMKAGPTPWQKLASTGTVPGAPDFRSMTANLQSSSLDQAVRSGGATKGGTANVSGKTCQLYTFSAAGGSQEMCVADNLPLRIVSTATGGIKTTMTFSDFNASIQISAPI